MGLSALQIERAKASAKLYRLFDGEGLFIEITPTGAKRWRVKYFLDGRERRLSLGLYSLSRGNCFQPLAAKSASHSGNILRIAAGASRPNSPRSTDVNGVVAEMM